MSPVLKVAHPQHQVLQKLLPQQKKMKDHREMLGQLKRGDRVVTAGGIVATITKVKDGSDEIEAEIAPNVKVTVVRGTIGSVLRPEAANDEAKS